MDTENRKGDTDETRRQLTDLSNALAETEARCTQQREQTQNTKSKASVCGCRGWELLRLGREKKKQDKEEEMS